MQRYKIEIDMLHVMLSMIYYIEKQVQHDCAIDIENDIKNLICDLENEVI